MPEGPEKPVPTYSRARQYQIAGVLIVLALVLFWLVPLAWHAVFDAPPPPPEHHEDGSFAATDRQWQTLQFEKVRRETFHDGVTTDGKIAVDDDLTTNVMSPYTGRVTRIFVEAGASVRAGQPLFAVQASEASQTAADIATAAASADAARTAFKASEAAEARQHDLFQHQGAALKDWQQAQADLGNARSNLRGAEAALAAARGHAAALGGASSSGEAIVRAPVAGVVTQRLIGVGQNIGSISASNSPTQAMTISNLSRVWVVGYIREEDAARAHRGQAAELVLASAPDNKIATHIDYVSPTLDPVTHRLTVRAVLDNASGALKPEMIGSFSLLTGGDRAVLSVPESAVVFEGDTARVWVATGKPNERRLLLRQIKAGIERNGRIEVVSGLNEGDTVVTAGSLFIDRGAKED
ncbi:MAG TPA: efflux RND transporter periplasmic adaptor subunit [Novosphingobium sp.]|nr:efflux RND transporter periplasmic adaptor subunit [Novosphingobium sp.]